MGFVYFHDLGDVTQVVLKVKRKNMLRFIRNEYKLIIPGIAAGLSTAALVDNLEPDIRCQPILA